jgi:hypothetical protein
MSGNYLDYKQFVVVVLYILKVGNLDGTDLDHTLMLIQVLMVIINNLVNMLVVILVDILSISINIRVRVRVDIILVHRMDGIGLLNMLV